jgi:hypothetical protein
MSERSKKIIFAIFFVAFSIGMGYALFYLFFRAGQPQPTAPGAPGVTGQLPSAGTGVPTAATPTAPGGLPPSAVAFPPEAPAIAGQPIAPSKTHLLRDGVTQAVTPSPDGSGARFYNPEDGRFYRVGPDGTITLMSEKQFFNVQTVDWGKKNDQAILEFPDGSNVFYDFQQKKQVVLPKHWEDFDFSPTDQKVAAKSIGVDVNNRFLITANPDGTETKALEPLGNNAALVHDAWAPNGQIVAYAETGEAQPDNGQEIYFVGQNHENYRSLIAPGQGFLPTWSPTGKQLLFSVYNNDTQDKPSLWLTAGEPGTIGANRKNLNIQTWADKCAWAGDTDLYCGVPQGLPDNAGLQRSDFTSFPDDLFHIDLTQGTVTKISTPDQVFPVRQPVLNKDHTKFIFTDAQTGKLYSYDLK